MEHQNHLGVSLRNVQVQKKICTNGIHKSTIRADPRSEVFKYINQKDSQRPCSCYVYIILYVGNGTKVLNN